MTSIKNAEMRLGEAPPYNASLELYNPTLVMVNIDREEVKP